MTSQSPYRDLAARAFWRTGYAEVSYPPEGLYQPRWTLSKTDKIVTAGSCFAQHVGRTLRQNGFNVVEKEPASEDPRKLTGREAAHGYGLYSARYGNLYTARQLHQILQEALGLITPADPVWESKGRFYDSLRPNIEPDGFDSPDAVRKARKIHLQRVKEAFVEANVFVFTLGLTEAWIHRETGQIYATAPGTIAGSFDPKLHAFKNFRHHEIIEDLRATLALLKGINPGLRVLLTVSPVPLTATATGDHVLSATTYSKSVLRAVAGELRNDHPEIDYFPSFEIITSLRAGASFFEENLRNVTEDGVALAMRTFLTAHLPAEELAEKTKKSAKGDKAEATAKPAKDKLPAAPAGANLPDPKPVEAPKGAKIAAEMSGILVPVSPYTSRKGFLERLTQTSGYEADEINCAKALLRKGDRILEMGAGLGVVGACLARTGLPGAIRSYEANFSLLPHIKELYGINGVEDRIELRNAVVMVQPGPKQLPFYVSPRFAYSSLIKPVDVSSTEVMVNTEQFSDIVADFAPDLLVIDIEGGEMEFLKGADLSKIRGICIEWHPKLYGVEGMRKCKGILRKAGFEVVEPVSTRTVWAASR